MRGRTIATAALTLTLLIAAPLLIADSPKQDGKNDGAWKTLFNGENLEGWEQVNGTGKYEVKDGAIVGTTAEGSPNSFLCTSEQYGDFVLTMGVKLDDNELNSGIQIRSATKGDDPNGRVYGPQVEIEAGPGDAGYVYGEATGLRWLSEDREENRGTFQNGQWNEYRIKAVDDRIQTWINGQQVADLKITDKMKEKLPNQGRKGFICLQVHSIPSDQGPYSVRWRNIKIKPLGGGQAE